MTKHESGRTPNMRSTIYEGGDGWWHGRVTMGVMPDGRADRRHRKAKTESEVTAKVRELERIRDAGKTTKAGRKPTVAQWMSDTFLGSHCALRVSQGKMSPRTLEDYESKARNWIIPLLGAHRVDQLRLGHLEAAYAAMMREGLAHASVVKCHRIIARALKVATQREIVGRNVAELVEMEEPEQPEVDAYSRGECRAILAAAAGRRNAARWSVALALGVRQGEALGLRWEYVVATCTACLESHPITQTKTGCPCGGKYRITVRAWHQVQRAPYGHGCDDAAECSREHHKKACRRGCRQHQHEETCRKGCKRAGHACITRPCPKDCKGHASKCARRTGGGWVFRPRKGKRRLTLACPPELAPVLRQHLKAQREERVAAEYWEDYGLVFPGRYGQPVDRGEDWRQWKALCAAAGVREGRLHDARHTAATLLVEQGVHTRTIQEVLGHARVTTTERYTHVASPLAEEAAARMGAAIL